MSKDLTMQVQCFYHASGMPAACFSVAGREPLVPGKHHVWVYHATTQRTTRHAVLRVQMQELDLCYVWIGPEDKFISHNPELLPVKVRRSGQGAEVAPEGGYV